METIMEPPKLVRPWEVCVCVCVSGLHTGWVTEAQPISRRPQPKTEQRLSRFSHILALTVSLELHLTVGTGFSPVTAFTHSKRHISALAWLACLTLTVCAIMFLITSFVCVYSNSELHFCILRNETLISSCELWQLAQPDLLDSSTECVTYNWDTNPSVEQCCMSAIVLFPTDIFSKLHCRTGRNWTSALGWTLEELYVSV